MKHWLQKFFAVGFVLTLLIGCSSANDQGTERADSDKANISQTEQSIVITISENEGEHVIAEKELTVKGNQTLMNVLKDEFNIEEENGFITAVEGIVADESEKEAWAIIINEEMAMVGANEYEIQDGDKIVLDLQPWE